MAELYDKYDFNPDRDDISIEGEEHVIPNEEPYEIYLRHIPDVDSVSISGGFSSTPAESPGEDEFYVVEGENLGRIRFNEENRGDSIEVDYDVIGTVIWAEERDQEGDLVEGVNTIQSEIETNEGNISDNREDIDRIEDDVLADGRWIIESTPGSEQEAANFRASASGSNVGVAFDGDNFWVSSDYGIYGIFVLYS